MLEHYNTCILFDSLYNPALVSHQSVSKYVSNE